MTTTSGPSFPRADGLYRREQVRGRVYRYLRFFDESSSAITCTTSSGDAEKVKLWFNVGHANR